MKSIYSIGALALLAAIAVSPVQAAENTAHGKPQPARIQPMASGTAVVYDAVVGADGTFIRGHAASSTNLGTGIYQVDFHANVTKCAYVVTLGTTSDGTAAPGYMTVASRAGDVKGVWVQTFDTTGTALNQSFHIVVAC
jgi:hypothetical protein